jgi:diguanylate cyclase (GGDEF)-like protein
MTPDSPITVQLCLDDESLRRRARACLAAGGDGARVFDDCDDRDEGNQRDDGEIDVIVADHALSGDRDRTIGRVYLGEGDSRRLRVDAVLPVDFLDRELVLVCGLVARSARLRRQLELGDTARRVLLDQALTDPTTTLPNRRGWEAQFTHSLARCREREEHLCVAVIDLDHFKRINDTLGHTAGDEVLRRLGLHLAEALRKDDFVARLGGDEFALLLPEVEPEDAHAVVDRIRRGVTGIDIRDLITEPSAAVAAGAVLPLPPHPATSSYRNCPTVTASAGYACVTPADLDDSDDEANLRETILATADRAMYEAKTAGRNCTRGG